MQVNKIFEGNALSILSTFLEQSIHTCITSPPYYGLRDYKTPVQQWPSVEYSILGFPVLVPAMECHLGLEPNHFAFVGHIVSIFREVHRVLRDDGTLWLNFGDSYTGYKANTGDTKYAGYSNRPKHKEGWQYNGMKPKDLMGIPWMVAFALRDDGWYLRQDIIWHKPNPMPESVTDRCTKAHEYIFLLSKQQQYYFDAEAIKEAAVTNDDIIRDRETTKLNNVPGRTKMNGLVNNNYNKRNKRSVWPVVSQPFSDAHFATFPEALITDCIRASTSEHGCCSKCGTQWRRVVEKSGGSIGKSWTKHEHDLQIGMLKNNTTDAKRAMADGSYRVCHLGWQPSCSCGINDIVPAVVLDPFIGSGTTGLVASKLNRSYLGIELGSHHITIAHNRLRKQLGLFY